MIAITIDSRDEFEKVFPIPKYVIRCGKGYACTEYNAWEGHDFIKKWEGWSAAMLQCKADVTLANEGDIQAGNSPVIDIDPASGPDRTVEVRYVAPPGYVMVPKEPTDEMIAAAMNCEDVLFNSDESFCVQFGNIYEAMLAAAPQEVKGE